MNYGYTLVTPDNMGVGFGQVLPPLSKTRGHERQNSGTTTITGCWWVATDVVDAGGGNYTVSGDYIYNLATVQYESALGDVVTSDGRFMAQPLYIYNQIIYAYIPLPFTLKNIVTRLEITSDKTMILEKGDVTFNPYGGGSLFAHQSPPSVDPDLVATGRIPFLGMQDCRANTSPWVLQRPDGFIYPLLRPSDYRSGSGRIDGIYYKAASPCCWCYKYPGYSANVDVGVKEDMEQILHDYYQLPSTYPPGRFTSAYCFCMFEDSTVKPDYLVYV